MPSILRTGSIIDADIGSVAFGGDGVARHQGCVVFIPFGATGDKLRVRVSQAKKNFARAEILEILHPGPGREKSPCPYFGKCGGCRYQHLSYETELSTKESQVRELIQRIGRLGNPHLLPIIRSPEPYGYRNRITVHSEEGRIGFRDTEGRRVVDIEKCLLAAPEINGQLAELRQRHPGREHISLRSPGLPRSGFSQNNRHMLDMLQKLVVEATCSGSPVVEGYAGSGFFSLPLAEKGIRVIGVESDPRLVKDGHRTLPANAILLEGSCEALLPEAHAQAEHPFPVCLLDPPREGLAPEVITHLLGLPFQKLVYLSCNPATLARDLERLSGKWQLQSLQPIDLFPRTSHVECLAVFSPKEAHREA